MRSFSFRAFGGGALAVAFVVLVATDGCSSASSSNGSGFDDSDGAATPDGTGTDATSGNKDGASGTDTGITFDSSTTADASSGDDSAPTDAPYSFDGYAHLDGYSEASYCPDDDGDGFTVCDGDCNDHDSLINPCAFDTNAASGDPVGSDGIDNDCDGTVDNRRLCDQTLTNGHDTNAVDYATAMDICPNADPRCVWVKSAIFYGPSVTNAHRVTAHMGNNVGFHPHAGSFEAFFATGTSDDDVDTPAYRTGDGTDFMNTFTHPSPLPANQNVNPCNTGVDESTVAIHDYTELRLTLLAPVNAGSFTFDFNFFSEEYPVYVCQGFNDTFLAMQTSQQYPPSTYPHGFQVALRSERPPREREQLVLPRLQLDHEPVRLQPHLRESDHRLDRHRIRDPVRRRARSHVELHVGQRRSRKRGDRLAEDDIADQSGRDVHPELHRLRRARRDPGFRRRPRQLPVELDDPL